MVLKILCDIGDNCRSWVSTAIYIRRIHIEFVCDIRHVTEVGCEYPIVVGSVEICLCSISSEHLRVNIDRSLVVVEEVVHSADTCVGCHPERVDLGCLGSEVSGTDSTEGCCYCPRSTVSHDLCDVKPVFSLESLCECVCHTLHMSLCLPEVGVCHLIVRCALKEVVIACSESYHSKRSAGHISEYSFHILSYLNVMFKPITAVLICG